MRFKRLGRYELLEELAGDATGALYKARDPLLGRLVAIQTVEREALADSGNPNFERKTKLAGGLAHPNLVTVHDAGISRDVAYIATELIEGETLREILDSGVDLPPAAIERIAAQAADGLDFMHRRAIVHGDVNPSTVVVLDIGFVKISCLGNALYPVGTCVPVDRVCATSHYLSPEHVTGARIDARSDVFSLGVVLYEMLTGIAPFPAGTLGELVDVITKKHPRPPSTLNRSIPSGFDYIVARALSKDPDHRYQSARDMAIHLRRWALEGPTFFAVPHTAAPQAQTAVIHAITAAPASAASAPSSGDALPEKPVAGGGLLRTRRQWLRYGIPGALLATSAAWTIWSGSKPAPKRITVSLPSASPKPEASEGSELVPVHDDVAPASGQADVEALSASGPASAGTHVEGRPVAQLKLAVSPWGEIYVDGRKRGVSPPLRQIDLAPGKHRIEIRNTTFPTRRESVEARPHAHLRIKHKFSR